MYLYRYLFSDVHMERHVHTIVIFDYFKHKLQEMIMKKCSILLFDNINTIEFEVQIMSWNSQTW